MNKYAPEKVFILENNSYIEISYEELCERTKLNKEYASKLFLPLHGMLMEVTKNVYDEFYREEERQKYLNRQSEKNGDISYDMLTAEGSNGENILADPSLPVCEQVDSRILREKLLNALKQLSSEEQELLRLIYVREMTERAIAVRYGISQVAVNKKKQKLLQKLKKIIDN